MRQYVTPTKRAHVYVVQFASGVGHVLYETDGMPLEAGKRQRVPDVGWLELAGCAGTEVAYVVASEAPLRQADAALADLVQSVATPSDAPPKLACVVVIRFELTHAVGRKGE